MITLGPNSQSPTTFSGATHGAATGRTANFGYGSLGSGVPVHSGIMQASGPQPHGRQLTTAESSDIGGPAQMIMGRVANFAKGQMSGGGSGSGGGGGGIPGAGGAGEGAAGAEGAAGTLAELAPLAAL